MQIQTLTFEQLIGTVAVVLLLVGIYNTVMSAVKTHREEKKRRNAPVNTLEETVRQHETKLDNDHQRLTDLEKANRIQMRALMAMLSHEINGNSTDKLKESMDEIHDFLVEK